MLGLGAGIAAGAILGSLTRATADGTHWDYHTHGGGNAWGDLTDASSGEQAFPDCNLARQSPVNIPLDAPLNDGLSVDYHATRLAVLNNGHTIQVNYEPGSTLTVDGRSYDLLQFHFHSPSEHEIEGDRTALEGHFVHQASDGEYAVLGVMIVPGKANAAFGHILEVMPHEEGARETGGKIEVAAFLPDDLRYWAYDGSFTTPPCTEGVKWHVLYEPVSVSLQQVAAFRALPFLSHEGEFIGNARPVQPLNGRLAPESIAGVTPPATGSAGLAAR